MRDPEHAAILGRLDRIEDNALPHIREAITRIERLLYLAVGLLAGLGVKEVIQWVS